MPVEADREVGPPAERLVLLPTVTDPDLFGPVGALKNFVDDAAVDLYHAGEAMFDVRARSEDFREGMDAFLNKRTPNWKGK